MEYSKWASELFEETYPRYDFNRNGTILWKNEYSLSIQWGNREYSLEFNDLYNEDDSNPLDVIMLWAYRNLPLLENEYPECYIHWDISRQRYIATINRGFGITYAESVNSPNSFPKHGQLDKDVFGWSIKGSMLCIESKIEGVPALCPLSHSDTFERVVSNFFYPDKGVMLMVPTGNGQKVFVGNINPIQRIHDEKRGVESIPLETWVQEISYHKSGSKND